MNNFLKLAIGSIAALLITSCKHSADFNNELNEPLPIVSVLKDDGFTKFITPNICPILGVTNPLTANEIEFLYAIREDEKLSKDLYTSFSIVYPTSFPLLNIATAEATHIAAIETVLSYYEIAYPALAPAGVFADPVRQAKYDALSAPKLSLLDTYKAMATLEEESIVYYKAVETDIANPNIQIIVNNMMKASSNHLKAIVRQIANLGEIYIPTTLSQVDYEVIINAAFLQGNQYGEHAGNGNQRGNCNSQKGGKHQGNKGNVNGAGICTSTINGTAPGTNSNAGQTGKGYRGK